MASINKIMVGNDSYDIIPSLGTGLCNSDGDVSINIGSGIAHDANGKLILNIGSEFTYNSEKKLRLNLGTAVVSGSSNTNCGIAITDGEFTISKNDFKDFLNSLGVAFK